MLVLAVGGHWALLQSVAWVRMTMSFSQFAPLDKALKMTFGGEHPCTLCKIVKAGQNAERETQRRSFDKKMDWFFPERFVVIHQPMERLPAPAAAEPGSSRKEAPPRPPPRVA